MAMRTIVGFDAFPATMSGSNPVQGSGITGALGVTAGGGSANNYTMGVSSAAADDMGIGTPDRRRSLVSWKNTTVNAVAVVLVSAPSAFNVPANAGKTYKHVVGFTFKDRSGDQNPNIQAILLASTRNQNGSSTTTALPIFGIQTNGTFILAGSGTSIQRELNREYSVELVWTWTVPEAGGTSFPVQLQAYLDGELRVNSANWQTIPGHNQATVFMSNLQMGITGALAADNRARRYCFADLYVMQITPDSEAPYNDRIGPQKVLPVRVSSVASNAGWTNEGGATDLAAALSDGNDATLARSPNDDGVLQLKLDIPTAADTSINGIRMFVRSKRGVSSNRDLRIELKDGDTTLLDRTNTPTSTLADSVAAVLLPSKTADRESLKSSVLSNATLHLRAVTP